MSFQVFPRIRELGLTSPTGVVQVGASIGQEMREFVEAGVRTGVFIEPLAQPFQVLSKICKSIPNFVAVNALCAETTGKRYLFHVASNGGQSSSILAPALHEKIYPSVRFEEQVELVSRTLDDVLHNVKDAGYSQVVENARLLYMDCQGAEFSILRGLNEHIQQFDYIYTEVMRNELYRGQVAFLDYCHFLDAIGFTLNDVYFGYPSHGGNALFIKKKLLGMQ